MRLIKFVQGVPKLFFTRPLPKTLLVIIVVLVESSVLLTAGRFAQSNLKFSDVQATTLLTERRTNKQTNKVIDI